MERLCICGCGDPVKPRYTYAKRHKSRPVPKAELPDPNPTGLCFCGCGLTTQKAKRTYSKLFQFKGRHVRYVHGHAGWKLNAEQTSRWRGGRIITDEGYIKVRVGEPGSRSYRLEHRVVMEQVLGRPLEPWESVHHINGVRDDNRPENLELWRRSHPDGQRTNDYHCPGCCCPK